MASSLALALFLIAPAFAYIQVPWQTQKMYGFDGPWNAVSVNVGGFMNGTVLQRQWVSVDLLPGGEWSSYIPSKTYCTNNNHSGICGLAGTWNPGNMHTASGANIAFQPTFNEVNSSGTWIRGSVFAQNINVGDGVGGYQSFTTPNSSLVSFNTGNTTLPSGKQVEVEIGSLALGADDLAQQFTGSDTNASIPSIYAWNIPGYLFNTSTTKSSSYGLHIGAARLGYTGSLIFGGYDKGRAIGPGTTWSTGNPQLQDIVIGVETGGSPFSFPSKTGLLIDDSGSNTAMDASPDPLSPYLTLPAKTCENLATILPIQHDVASNYYLWNTNDPMYQKIVSSPSYLGFVFPPAVGGSTPVTIKVPFALLNLTLTAPAISSGTKQYFPCQPLQTKGGTPVLGRAFLQAAFIGRNWRSRVSFLAQAPGPGDSGNGLGVSPTDIQDTDTSLQYVTGDDLFSRSWSKHWTPLPGSDGNNQPNNAGSQSSSNSGLSAGAKAGIGVGVTLAVLAIVGANVAFFLFRRRRRHNRPSSLHSDEPGWYDPHTNSLHNATTSTPYTKDKPYDPYISPQNQHSYGREQYAYYKQDRLAPERPQPQELENSYRGRELQELAPQSPQSPQELDAGDREWHHGFR